MDLNDNAKLVLKELEPYIQQINEKDKCPGTKLLGHTAVVHYYTLNNESKEILKKHAEGLYSWVQPDLPEDLSFLKQDGTSWLINTAHESFSHVDSNNNDEIEM